MNVLSLSAALLTVSCLVGQDASEAAMLGKAEQSYQKLGAESDVQVSAWNEKIVALQEQCKMCAALARTKEAKAVRGPFSGGGRAFRRQHARRELHTHRPLDTGVERAHGRQALDVDEVLAWAVVDRTIRNDDGPFHWYCFGECRPHNYYWYEEPTAGTLHLIPWDLDNAFQNIVIDYNPVTPVADAWGEITRDCQRFGYGDWGVLQRSAACDPVFAAWATFDDDHRRLLDEFLDGPFAEELVTAQVEAWVAQIADATTEAAE